MGTVRIYLLLALAVLPAFAIAASPYVISGLSTDLVFTEAVAQAEKLGGDCQLAASRNDDGGTSAQCEYRHCPQGGPSAGCDQPHPDKPALTIAAQPILKIGLEAPGEEAHLSRIVFLFEGDAAAVALDLRQKFGAPDRDGAAESAQSWSNSRRLSWKQGDYRLGLVDSPQLIIMAVDRAEAAAPPLP
ncbi:MAG: hypothetical protein R3E50_02925 [Halioglobus sp.]